MTELTKAPIVRLFELEVSPDYEEDFKQVGFHNLSTSIKTEVGTLAMYSARNPEVVGQTIVVEVYADEAAYQRHVASEQFADFVKVAQVGLTSRSVYELDPMLLLEKEEALYLEKATTYCIRLVQLEVYEKYHEDFAAIILEEMRESMVKEEGILVMYAGTLKDNPTSWRFFEIYADENAYEKHRQMLRFQTSIEGTAHMIRNKKLLNLSGDLLVNQGGLSFG